MASHFEQIIAEISRIEAEVDELILAEELEIQRLRNNSSYFTKVAKAIEKNNSIRDEPQIPPSSTNIETETNGVDFPAEQAALSKENEGSSLSKLDEILQLAQRTREIRSSQSFPNDFTRRSISSNNGKADFVNHSVSSSSVKSLRSSHASKASHHVTTTVNNNNQNNSSSHSNMKKLLPVPRQQLKLMSGGPLPPKPAEITTTQPLSAFVDIALNDLKQQQKVVTDPILTHFEDIQGLFSQFVMRDKLVASSSSLHRLHRSQARLLDMSPLLLTWKSFEYDYNRNASVCLPVMDAKLKKAMQDDSADQDEIYKLIMQDVNSFAQLCNIVFSTPRLPSHKVPQLIAGWAKLCIWQQLLNEESQSSSTERKQQNDSNVQIKHLQLQLDNKIQRVLISNLQQHSLGQRLMQIDESLSLDVILAQFSRVPSQEWVQWCEHLKVARDVANEHKKSGKIMFQRRVVECHKKK